MCQISNTKRCQHHNLLDLPLRKEPPSSQWIDRTKGRLEDQPQCPCENVISTNSDQTLVWLIIYYSFLNTSLHCAILWWDSTPFNVISSLRTENHIPLELLLPVEAPVKFSSISCHLFDDWLIVLCSYSWMSIVSAPCHNRGCEWS
jgi:hypothetical protein